LGLAGVRTFLRRHSRIAIDSNVFIYRIELHPAYDELTKVIFSWLEAPGHTAVTSTITMTELLVKPYATNDIPLVWRYFSLLSTFPNLDWYPTSLKVATRAAQLRAAHNMRTPDALQAATALVAEATGFVTNDAVFKRVPGFEPLILSELTRSA
jgi:predicted nucleic acid-binding protein